MALLQGLDNASWIDARLQLVNPNLTIKRNTLYNSGSYQLISKLTGLTLFNGFKTCFLRANDLNGDPLGSGAYITGDSSSYLPNVIGGVFSTIRNFDVQTDVYDVVGNVRIKKVSEIFPLGVYGNAVMPYVVPNRDYNNNPPWTGITPTLCTPNILTHDYDDWFVVESDGVDFYNRKSSENLPREKMPHNFLPTVIFSFDGYTDSSNYPKYNTIYRTEAGHAFIQATTRQESILSSAMGYNVFLKYRATGYYVMSIGGILNGDLTPTFGALGDIVPVTGSTSDEFIRFDPKGKVVLGGNTTLLMYDPLYNGGTKISYLAFKNVDAIKKYYADFGVSVFIDDEYAARNTPREDLPPIEGEEVPSPELPSVGYPSGVVTSIPSYPDNSSDTVDIVSPSINATDVMSMYALDITQTKGFMEWLMTDDYTKNVSELFGNKISALSGLRLYPFDIEKHDPLHTTVKQKIVVGGVISTTIGIAIGAGYNTIIDGGQITLQGYFGDFSDYLHCSYSIYIPYAGIVPLNPSDVVNRNIVVKYALDLGSGSATALIYSNGVLIKTVPARLGVDVPITYSDANSVKMANAMYFNGIVSSLIGSVAGIAANVATGNIVGASTGAIGGITSLAASAANSKYREQISLGNVGTIGDMSAYSLPQTCFLIITRQRRGAPDYETIAGIPSTISGKLGNFVGSGYVSFKTDKIVGISATTEEIEEIKSLLVSGIFV